MNILSLDFGTNTGWAFGRDGGLVDCGTLLLAKPKEITLARKERMDRRCDGRVLALDRFLRNRLDLYKPHWVVFEDVQFSSTTMQTQLWAAFRSVAWLLRKEGVDLECCPVGTLKAFATGNGAATKDMMAVALARRYPERFALVDGKIRDTKGYFFDDNAVDAIHLFYWAVNALKNLTPKP